VPLGSLLPFVATVFVLLIGGEAELATGVPLGEYFTSGSFPTFPTRITLFTLLGMSRDSNHQRICQPRMQLKEKFKNCAELIRGGGSAGSGLQMACPAP
jgi:hypothetical protein